MDWSFEKIVCKELEKIANIRCKFKYQRRRKNKRFEKKKETERVARECQKRNRDFFFVTTQQTPQASDLKLKRL